MTQDDIMRKVMACLRLAKSNNANEAALAAAKAQELITRYQLDVNALDYDKQAKELDDEVIMNYTGSDPLDTAEKRDRGWALRLASVLSRANCCRVLQVPNADGKGSKRIDIIGRPSDTATVRYLYSFLKNEVHRLCDQNTKGNSGTYKNHYRTGVVDAIAEKVSAMKAQTIKDLKQENAHNPMALVRVNNAVARLEQRGQSVEAFLGRMNLGKGTASGYAKTSSGGRAHGQRDGRTINIGAKGALGRGVAGALN